MNDLVGELKDLLQRIHKAGLKVFVHDADGMSYSLVIAPTEQEAREKIVSARRSEAWDEENEGILELDGNPL